MEREIRQRQSAVYFSGDAVIWLGIWSIVKVVLALWLGVIDWEGIIAEITKQPDFEATLGAMFLTIIILAGITLFLHIFIGRSAVREGRGDHVSIAYVIVAIVYFLLIVLLDVIFWNQMVEFTVREESYGLHNILTSLVFDVTLGIALLVIIVNSLKLRKIKSAEGRN